MPAREKVLQKNSVFQLVNLLSPGEKRRFSTFLESPYFNTEPRMGILFRLLIADPPPEREKCWEQLEGPIPYNDARMRQWLTRLFSLVRRFITVRAYENHPFLQHPVWLEELHQRNAPNIFQKEWKSAEKHFNESHLRNGNYYLQRFQLEYVKELELAKFGQRTNRKSGVPTMKKLLETYCELTDAHLDCLHWGLQKTQGKKADLNLATANLPIAPNLFRELSNFLSQDGLQGAQLFINHFRTFGTHYAPDERYDLFTGFLNKLVLSLNHGNSNEVMGQIFELYQYALKAEIIVHEGQIDGAYFKNIVEAGLLLGKHQEVDRFIQEYEPSLSIGTRTYLVPYAQARLSFFKGDYGQTLSLLNRTNIPDPILHLNARLLKLKTCYELKEFSLLENGIKSLAQYLRESLKLPQETRRKFGNRLKFLRRLYENPKPAKLQALKEDIEATEKPIDAEWFLKKINQLIPNKKLR